MEQFTQGIDALLSALRLARLAFTILRKNHAMGGPAKGGLFCLGGGDSARHLKQPILCQA